MAPNNNVLIRAGKTDESVGRLPWQRIAVGRRPVPKGRAISIPEKAIRRCYQGYLRLNRTALRLQIVRRTFAIVVAFLVMLSVASPALVCLRPGRAMTAAEHACCKKMARMCGSANMPQSHSCCQKEVPPGNTLILIAHQQFAPALQVITVLSTPFSSREFELPGTTLERPPSHSPPDSSVLRI